MAFSPDYLVRNRLKGAAISKKEKEIIINVYCYFRNQDNSKKIDEIVKETAAATKFSERSIYRIKTETKKAVFEECQIKDGKKKGVHYKQKYQLYNNHVMSAIRNIIHRNFFQQNEQPTLKKIHAAVRSDENLPNMCITTLHKILKELGFIYSSRKRNAVLIERPEIAEWRHRYLRKIKRYREQKRNIVYTDETWVNAGHTTNKIWQDTTIKSHRQAHNEGLTTGLKNPSGRGARLIITDAGGEGGFIPNARSIFTAKKGDGDYYKEMNSTTYETWFRDQLIPNLRPNSIIVLDNASYHSAKKELIPRRGWRKKDIQDWLDKKNINYRGDMIISELLELVEPLRNQYETKKIDEMAREAGHEVLRTPPYHCELNPIELVWGSGKGHVAMNNKTFKLQEVEGLIVEGLSKVTPEQWQANENHVITVEEDMWNKEHLVDLFHATQIPPVIISPYEVRDDDSDEEDGESDCDCEYEE